MLDTTGCHTPLLQSRVLEEALQDHDLSYVVHTGEPFWCHNEVLDVVAFLRVMADPTMADSELLTSVLTRPHTEGIPGKTLSSSLCSSSQKLAHCFDNGTIKAVVDRLSERCCPMQSVDMV